MPIVSLTFGACAFVPLVLRGALLSAAAGALFAAGAGGVTFSAAAADSFLSAVSSEPALSV